MQGELSDSDLIRKLSTSSADEKKDIYLILYERYKSLVLTIAYHYVKDYDRAGDVMHEVFLRVIQKAQDIKQPDLFKSWLMTVTRNLSVDSLRSASYISDTALDEQISVSSSERQEDAMIAELDRQKILEHLKDCVGRLEEVDLRIFKMRWQGLKTAQIGKILGTDKTQIRRAYDNMRTVLETCMHRKGFDLSIAQMLLLGEIDEGQ